MAHTDTTLDAALAEGLGESSPEQVGAVAAQVASTFGSATLALIHYGSRAHGQDAAGSDPRPESADDFFVIVTNYREAYRAAARTSHYNPSVAAALNHVMPPNVISVACDGGGAQPRVAKCAVLSSADLVRGCSSRAPDHFVRGRLFQQVRLPWVRDDDARTIVTNAIVAARVGTFDWARSYLPASFDASAYCRVLLETSFAAEIRPEAAARVDVLLGAQARSLVPMYDALLSNLALDGSLIANNAMYADAHPPGWLARRRVAFYFRRSKFRATARWAKYVVLYDDWLEYVVQKIARRSGTSITLTPRERRWPLLFLWPKAFRYLRARPQRQRAGGRA